MRIFNVKKTDNTFHLVKSIEKYPGASIIKLSGDFNFDTIPHTENIFRKYQEYLNEDIVLDFKEVTHVDTSTLAVLIYLINRLKQHGRKLYLVNINDTIREIIRIEKLESIINVYDTLEDVFRKL